MYKPGKKEIKFLRQKKATVYLQKHLVELNFWYNLLRYCIFIYAPIQFFWSISNQSSILHQYREENLKIVT